MSDRTFWIVFAGWSVFVIGMIRWMYVQVRKVDRMQDMDVDYEKLFVACGEELAREQDGYAKDAAVAIPESQWQQNARQAEGLAWSEDSTPPRNAA